MPDPSIPPNAHKTAEVPVLISGAGPTGLFTALLLTKMNIPCRILERDLHFSPLSKALAIHSRTQEILQMTDPELIQQFLDVGYFPEKVRFYFDGKLVSGFDIIPGSESHYSKILLVPQAKTVQILSNALEKAGGKIEWGWELVDTKVVESIDGDSSSSSWVETTVRKAIQGTNTRVGESTILGTVELAGEDEEKMYEYETIKSQYLIGSDGGRSAVRHKIQMPFPGRTRDIHMILFDGTVKSNISMEHFTFISGKHNRTLGIFPIGEKDKVQLVLKLGSLTPDQFEAQKSCPPSIEAFQQLLDESISPLEITIQDAKLLTHYRINERRAKEFSYRGRIFLAGDSAHVHSPAGGQGLNMGLQDAYNLAWKMGMVINGTAPPSLLDSYGEERPAIADEVIKLTIKTLFMEFGDGNMFQRALRRAFITIAPIIVPLIKGSPPASMIGLRYYENSLNKKHKTQTTPSGTGAVGRRAQDGSLIPLQSKTSNSTITSATESSTATRLHELMANPGSFHILVFTGDLWTDRPESADDLSKMAERHLAHWRSKWPSAAKDQHQFRVHTLTTLYATTTAATVTGGANPSMEKKMGDGAAYTDLKGLLHCRYNVDSKVNKKYPDSAGALVVVRPDSHIAYRVQGVGESAWKDVDEYFGSILSHPMVEQ
ncbi:hypothetical protein EMPS_04124 [Entomortierella parvispora]|uniref:FAD-binding domain-containing protein n=1 Tax=Entomortierella parvispora TaxID=205924 RepID=A0A9P3LV84_9FUNG|nr:hypothetical protein EMPS_04124 [Entomortierella parvispora]